MAALLFAGRSGRVRNVALADILLHLSDGALEVGPGVNTRRFRFREWLEDADSDLPGINFQPEQGSQAT
jgi:hypothetical protein